MEKRHYEDFFSVPENFRSNMTRDAIDEMPETWLDFYPHPKYVEFLNTLLQVITTDGQKSVWLTGNFGTGKSNAALVTQKLFMDEEGRVRKWFEEYKDKISDTEALLNNLLACRSKGTLVVYDYNALGIGPHDDFIVRLERGIEAALSQKEMIVPAASNISEIIERLKREDQKFFETRDSIQEELAYLNSNIKTVDQLVKELRNTHYEQPALKHLLSDIQKVFHRDKIYLNTDITTFKKWIREILSANNLITIVYLFDEFHSFIETNKEYLKTFEDVTENPDISRFFLVPITHMKIEAYFAAGGQNAQKSNDRFYFRDLQIPDDTALKLAAHAMKPNPDPNIVEEWEREKNTLWEAVRGIAEMQFKSEEVRKDSFKNILPIHPIAAFLLKYLSESARSNQRSIFEYLKGSADGREFQDFIRMGGPAIAGKQFLTVDYLWRYFIERKDLGLNNEIIAIRSEFERIKSRDFQNKDDDDDDVRVLKTVLLFCLLTRLNPDGHERLKATVKNIELAFQGDGAIVGVNGILKSLAEKLCFSIVGDNIELFSTSVGNADLQAKIVEYENKFHDLLSDKTAKMLEQYKKSDISKFSSGRFDFRVSDVGHMSLSNILPATREKYSSGQNKDIGALCLWFVVAKNKDEQLQIPEKIQGVLKQLRDHRIMMFTFPSLAFCDSNLNLWNDYITQYAQYMLENDSSARNQRKNAFERLERDWFDKIKRQETQIKIYTVLNEKVIVNETSWSKFKDYISDFVSRTIPYCIDCLTEQTTAFEVSGLKTWAYMGIQFDIASATGRHKQLIDAFKEQSITTDIGWFNHNQDHPIAQIRLLFDKKIANTIGKGTSFSVRKAYIELRRAPYGMKPNALSAFVLGIALRHILDKGYQWDNLQTTRALDVDSLAEIIESVVKDDGEDKIKLEKYICRLSREEKAFVEKAPRMFGIANTVTDARVDAALLEILTRIEQTSGRVPLWVLPEYIRSVGEPSADVIANALNNICLAGSTSSKSNKPEESKNAIKEVGQLLLDDDAIIDTVAGYIKPDNFVRAFELYVDRTAPALTSLAQNIGDVSHGYCQAILGKVAETAGWLWKQADISAEVDETIHEYEIIKLLLSTGAFSTYRPYKSAIETLRAAICDGNKLPMTLITDALPSLSALLSRIANNGKASDIKEGLEQNTILVKTLFFDISKSKSIELLRQKLGELAISDADLLNIYNSLPKAFSYDESVFLDDLRARVENFAKESGAQNIKAEWKRLTETDTPSIWANSNGLPARFAFDNLTESNDIIAAVEAPENFSSEKLAGLLNVLRGLAPIRIAECQERFLAETIHPNYSKLNINLSSLLDFMRNIYGNQPNNWPVKPDVNEFIQRQYKWTLAPQVIEKIKMASPEDIKNRVLQLAQDNPELGLLFWE